MRWLGQLSGLERKTLFVASAGWAVDGFDFVLYSFVMPALMAEWGMSRTQAGLVATGALITSSVGGWAAGALSDRWGRVRVLQVTIAWFSVCTFLSGLTNSFGQLAVVRALQGFGFGGEWAVGAVLVSEMMNASYRARAVGLMQSAYAVGWALATGAFVCAFSWLPPQNAWRALFFAALVPGLAVLYLTRHLVEPPVYLKASSSEGPERPPAFSIFSRDIRRTLLTASGLAIGVQGAYYAIVTWLPAYLRSVRGLTVLDTGGHLLMLIVGSFFGYLFGGSSMDLFGRRRTLIVFALLSACTCYLYFAVRLPASLVTLAGFPLGLTVCAMIGGLGAFLAELFPTSVRGSAQGFSYNFGRIAAALLPPLIGWLSTTHSLDALMATFAMASFACVVIATLLLPETQGRALSDLRPLP